MVYTLVLNVLVKVPVKICGRFGVLKYNTFCLLTHIKQQYLHEKRINADIVFDSKTYTVATGSFSVNFHFSESRIFMTPFP